MPGCGVLLKPEAVAEVPADVKVLSEIRDILAAKPRI